MDASLATERKSFLPLRLRSSTVSGSSHIPVVSRSTTPVSTSMQTATANDMKSSFTIGERVLVNGLKSGKIRYVGRVEFAHGLFCGIELDEPDGKHDGEVNNIRYFQCKPNCGVFVPNEKVILALRDRASSIQRTVSRLKPPAMTRSMTMSSSSQQIEPLFERNPSLPRQQSIQLPDIIPSPSTPPATMPEIPTKPIEIFNPVSVPKETRASPIQLQTAICTEPVESIETDFTDSVSLILHQLQQEPKVLLIEPRVSLTISEEGTIDDEDDDDDDDDEEDIDESKQNNQLPSSSTTLVKEPFQFVQTDLSCGKDETLTVVKPVIPKSTPLLKSSKSLSNSTASINRLKSVPSDTRLNLKKPTASTVVKKDLERRPSVPLINPRRSSLIPPKVTVPPTNKVTVTPLGSRTKLNSSSSSLCNSQSDLSSPAKSLPPSKRPSDPVRALPHPKFTKETPATVSRADFNALEQQSTMQKAMLQSLQTNSDRVKKQYEHLLHQFDLMSLCTQYCLTDKEHLQQDHQIQLSRNRTAYYRLKTRMEEVRMDHQQELDNHEQQHRTEIEQVKARHRQQSLDCQQKIEQLLHEKNQLESRCSSLQERVDDFMGEMANSEHADLLLCHVDKLEKDRTSLQTVLDLKGQELTQLRSRMNAQVFQREDQMALQKRIDMVENRNQDLTCLLRQWQLNEKSVVVERDALREQIVQLERDNLQLTFANEIFLYRARERAASVAGRAETPAKVIPPLTRRRLRRTPSFPFLPPVVHENARLRRSVSLNGISAR